MPDSVHRQEISRGDRGRQRTKTLFTKSNLLQLVETVPLSSTVNDSVLEQVSFNAPMEDGALNGPFIVAHGLELIRVPPLVVHQAGKVISLVEKLEHGGEDLRLLVGKGDALGDRVHVAVSQGAGEEGGRAEDVFVGGEEALFSSDDEGDDGRGRSSSCESSAIENETRA